LGTIAASSLLVVVATAMFVVVQLHARLRKRHQRVEKLYRFTKALSGSVDALTIAEHAACKARDLMGSEAAVLALFGVAPLVVVADVDVDVAYNTEFVHSAVLEVVRAAPHAQLVRSDADDIVRRLLTDNDWHEAVLAPLGYEGAFGWIAVGRPAAHEPFIDADVQLFEAFAHHTSIALEKGLLLDELDGEVRDRERRALCDPLTGLPNHVAIADALTHSLVFAEPDDQTAVMIMAPDVFAEVNEALGPDAGDQVLVEIAFRLGKLCADDWTAARLSGDRFAILIPDARDLGAAMRQAEALATSIDEHPFHVAGLVVELSLRVGVAVSPEHGETAATLFQRAEIALREAQRNHSRAALAVAAPDSGGRQLVLAHELQRAVEAEDFCVFVQPKRVLTDDLVTAVEVLVRWIRDDGTFFQPEDFIPIAERTGLIRPLTSLVLRKALEHRRQWVAAGYDIDLAVNASVRDLVDPAFPEQVAIALTRAVCPPSALTLEITESQIMSDPERVITAIRRLSLLGVRISIDDFGTGHSSLARLRSLQVDELKIDRAFVKNAATDMQDATLVRSITELGHALGLKVGAVGVEDDATFDLLRDIGVDVAQGFGIARPMPADALPAWLASAHSSPNALTPSEND
jgi:diguanylate cyclase (GGDEF)-like protein